MEICSSIANDFSVFRRDNQNSRSSLNALRKDFFKISFIFGKGEIEFLDQVVPIESPALLFSSFERPYTWKSLSSPQEGFFCVFRKDFMAVKSKEEEREELAIFTDSPTPVFLVKQEDFRFLNDLFERMLLESRSDYANKSLMIKNYIRIIIHQALKGSACKHIPKEVSANTRLANQFNHILENQFPLKTPHDKLEFTSANDFANLLSVHRNHLNRALKEVTGRTTSELISARLILEAKLLLGRSEWDIQEISYSLGFADSAYFHNFFKKHTGETPKNYRLKKL
jgi:AraC family transcriptional activator of pobA